MIMQWILPIQTSDIICQHYHYTIWWLSVWKRQGYDLCQRTAVPVYRYLVGSADSVTDHREGYCHSTPYPAFLSRDRGRPSPPMADTHQSPSVLSWRYYRCDVSRFMYVVFLGHSQDINSKQPCFRANIEWIISDFLSLTLGSARHVTHLLCVGYFTSPADLPTPKKFCQ